MTEEPKYPEVEVQLSGEDGNIFFIMGRVSKAMKRAGHNPNEFTNEVMDSASYEEALRVVRKWVVVS